MCLANYIGLMLKTVRLYSGYNDSTALVPEQCPSSSESAMEAESVWVIIVRAV